MLFDFYLFAIQVRYLRVDTCLEALRGVTVKEAEERLQEEYPYLSSDLFDYYEDHVQESGIPGVEVLHYDDTEGARIPNRPEFGDDAGASYDGAVLVRIKTTAATGAFPATLPAGIAAHLPPHTITSGTNSNGLMMPMADGDIIALIKDERGRTHDDQAIVAYSKGPDGVWKATTAFQTQVLGRKVNPFTREAIRPETDIVLRRVVTEVISGGRRLRSRAQRPKINARMTKRRQRS